MAKKQSRRRSRVHPTGRRRSKEQRNITFVTGTRAEFGLMETTLDWIVRHHKLKLQIVATGMHLSKKHGHTLDDIQKQGWKVDAIVPWPGGSSESSQAASTGRAVEKLTAAFEKLKTDIVLVVGDRVEAFAAATAGQISGKIVAHVHGGDRAMGQVDDTLRHAITKLSHIHFAATPQSADRIARLGEERSHIYCFGAPGIDGITSLAKGRAHIQRTYKVKAGRFGLVVLHPTDTNEKKESDRAKMLLTAMQADKRRYVIVYPNNDPGSAGISSVWDSLKDKPNLTLLKNVPRADFLGLMRDCATLIGNSSSGIIEAASFGTPVIDIGPRQEGREHGGNVLHVPFERSEISRAVRASGGESWNVRFPAVNLYGGANTGKRIAHTLGSLIITPTLRRKLITY